MIIEAVILPVKKGQSAEFEKAFSKAAKIIASMKGCISHSLQKCVEAEDKYLLLVEWNSVEDHENGFRKSAAYGEWKRLLHHFYEPFPVVEHYERIKC